MDDSFCNLPLPTLNLADIQQYRNEVQVWSLITPLEQNKQALTLVYSLPTEVRTDLLRVLDIQNLRKDTGVQYLLRHLENSNAGLNLAFKTFSEDCIQGSESNEEYIQRFKKKKEVLEKHHLESNDLMWTFHLIKGANLTREARDRVLKVLDPDSKTVLTDAEDALQDFKSPKRAKYKDSQEMYAEKDLCELPNEILNIILLHLVTRDIASLRLVCKRFHGIIEEFSPWRVLAPSYSSLTRLPSLLNHISKCRDLRTLILPSLKVLIDFNSLYVQVAASCPKLERLELTVYGRSDIDYLAFLFESCQEIKFIKLKSSDQVLIDLRALKMIGNRLPFLTELDISDNFMDSAELTYISQKFRNLNRLVVQVYGHSDEESNEAIRLISERCSMLKVVELRGIALESSTLESIGNNCKNLETFLLKPGRNIEQEVFLDFGKQAESLKHLTLETGAMGLAEFSSWTHSLLLGLKNLESFHLVSDKKWDCGLICLHAIAKDKFKFKELSLSMNVPSEAAHNISSSLKTFFQTEVGSRLESLVLSFSQEVSLKTLRDLGKCCPKLKQLHLSKVQISELDFLHILRGCQNLESIVLAQMDLQWACDIGRFCPNLKSFSATELEKITRDSILKHCKQLQKLDICGKLSKSDMESIAELEHLEILRFQGLENPNVIDVYLNSCTKLKEIYFGNYINDFAIRLRVTRPVSFNDYEDLDHHPWTWSHLVSKNSFNPAQ